MARVYLTYRRSEVSVAQAIAGKLRELGHDVVWDLDALLPGEDWRPLLLEQLRRADALVVLISHASLQSQFVMADIGAARALGKRVLPIVIDDAPVPPILSDLYCVGWGDAPEFASSCGMIHKALTGFGNRRVFIVHGHDEARVLELKAMLKDRKIDPIVLWEQDDRGMTIVEKFEHYARTCSFAFVLLTPDDQGKAVKSPKAEDRWRARQNVILELGWMMAHLGRDRVMMLYTGEMEIPSDILGVVYREFKERLAEIRGEIETRLANAGLLA